METTIKKAEPGVYANMSFAEYIAIPAFHKSMVAPALRATAHLKHHIETEKKASKQMNFGSLVDCLILEPDIFDTDFRLQPETYINSKDVEMPWTLRANTCKAWIEETAAAGQTPYSKADYDKALIIAGNIEDHKTAAQWLDDSLNQVAIVWEDEETGIMCKGRIDAVKPEMLIDLKTTFNASPNEFKRTMNAQGYHIQDAIYTEGWAALHDGDLLPFGFLVVESDAPFCVATYTLGTESRLTGQSLFRRAIRRYKDYLELGATGYSEFAEELEIPQWAVMLEADADV